MFGLIALVAFWAGVVRLWAVDGPKTPLIFVVIWLAGFFGFPYLGISGLFFLALEALMAALLLLIAQYKSSL